VVSRTSTLQFKGRTEDVRAMGRQLGARYVLEGGIRKSASAMRINMQLIDTQTGVHLWAETYNRDLKNADIFGVQDDITDRVVATVADAHGVLIRSIADGVEERPESELTASDWVVRHFGYLQSPTVERHLEIRDGLQRYLEREPRQAAVWACLAKMYVDEFCFGFNRRQDALDRALTAARRSLDLDRTFQYGVQVFAQVHFFRRDLPAFRNAAEQAIALNPRGTHTLAQMSLLFAHIREFERAVDLARRAMDLNPHHPGFYHVAVIWDYFQRGDYQKALEEVTRANIVGLFWQHLFVACCCGLLDRKPEAAAAVQELRKLDPEIELHLRHHIECFHYASGMMDRILEGLSKAGLKVPAESSGNSGN
jgi:tetratricopeptide (TPR) repeat protein